MGTLKKDVICIMPVRGGSNKLIEDVAINVKKSGAHFLRGGVF